MIDLPNVELPAWASQVLRETEESDLTRMFGYRTMARAKSQVGTRRVMGLRLDDPGSDELRIAKVRGQVLGRAKLEVCNVIITPNGIDSQCTCETHRLCDHGASLLLILCQQSKACSRNWQSAMDSLRGRAERYEAESLPQQQLGLQLDNESVQLGVIRAGHLRPGSLTWREATNQAFGLETAVYPKAQLRAVATLAEFATKHGFNGQLRLPLSALKHDGIGLLIECHQAGVDIRFEDQSPVRWDLQTVTLEMAVGTTAEGLELQLRPSRGTFYDAFGIIARTSDGLSLVDPRDGWPPSVSMMRAPMLVPSSDIPQFERYFAEHFAGWKVRGDGWEPPQRMCSGWRLDLVDEQVEVTYLSAPAGRDLRAAMGISPAESDRIDRQLCALVRDAGIPASPLLLRPGQHTISLRALVGHLRSLVDAARQSGFELQISPLVEAATEQQIAEIEMDVAAEQDWFRLQVKVRIGGVELPIADLVDALSKGMRYLKVRGQLVNLTDPALAALKAALEEADFIIDGEDVLAPRMRQAEVEELADLLEQSAAEQWRQSLKQLTQVSAPDVRAQATLRPYQLEGYRWLFGLASAKLGGVLADDMGLGKTLQMLTLVDVMEGPVLVVAPTSMLRTWVEEAHRFYPDMPVQLLSKTSRKAPEDYTETDAKLVVTSYALLRLEDEYHLTRRYRGVILDEAQAVKNPDTKSHRTARDLQSDWKFAVTGTPIENSVMDLWALMRIVAPGLLPKRDVFRSAYGSLIDQGDGPTDRLLEKVRYFMLRRTKSQVAQDLPDRVEQTISIELSAGHKRIYDRYLARERKRIMGLMGDAKSNRFKILSALTKLRQLALDPTLVDEPFDGTPTKVSYLLDSLRSVVGDGHRALVFSQFTRFLKRIAEDMKTAGFEYAYLDGATRDRQSVIDSFRQGSAQVFLISLKAGGTGLTLTEADYVYIMDPWWNPATEMQAVDRAHRIGQTRKVNVYRLISSGTIEANVEQLKARKQRVIDAVVTGDTVMITSGDIGGLIG